jgi:diguanylate cyclase (GGDEF)-like protein
VRTWTDQGRLECLRINARGDRRYRVDDLEAFLAEAARVGRRLPGRQSDGLEGVEERPPLRLVHDVGRGALAPATSDVEVPDARRRLEQSEALRRISRDLSAKLELEVVLGDLVDHAMTLFEADRGAVFLRERDGRYAPAVSRGLSQRYLDYVQAFRSPSIGAQALAEERCLAIVDYANDPRGAAVRSAVVQEGYDTVAAAPLVHDEQPLGLLMLYHDRRHPWQQSDMDVLDALAGQASLAISNARTYAQMATWAAQLQSIQQLGARLSRLSSVHEIALAIAAELRQLIDYHNVRVYKVIGDELEPVAWRGEIGEYTDEDAEQLRLKVGQGITGWVAANGVAQYLPDAAGDPRARTIPGTQDDLPESMLVAPLKFEDQVEGVIVLSKLGLHQFGDDELRLLEIYASLAAQALANADASERLAAQSTRLERQLRSQRDLLQITETILTTLDPAAVVSEIADRLGSLVSVDSLALYLIDPTGRELRPLIARGQYADLYMDHVLPLDGSLVGWAVRHGEAQLVPDQLTDPRVLPIKELGPVPGPLIVVPLRGPDTIIGGLILERLGSEAKFSEDEFELIKLYAAHVSIAMRNAEVHRAVEIRAQTDELTGLSNYRTFHEQLSKAVAQGVPFSLLMLDLDDFKSYNDRLGHQAGDALLQGIARALEKAGREADLVFRYGGDEFAMILPNTDASGIGAVAVAEKARRAVRSVVAGSLGRSGVPFAVTCSIGVATFPSDGRDASAMLLAADRACYVAKRSGRDRIATATEGLALAAEFLPMPPTPVDQPSVKGPVPTS